MEAARRRNVQEVKTRLSRIADRVTAGEDIGISNAGEPVTKVEPVTRAAPLRPRTARTGRGSLRGRIRMVPGFDEIPDDIADTFGML